MKKLLALLLTAMLVVSMAACGDSAETPATTTAPEATDPAPEATKPPEPTTVVGTLYTTFGAALKLDYNENGTVLAITGTNEAGTTIANAVQNQAGRACVFVLRTILRYAAENNLLGDAKTMTVRVGHGDPIPGKDFFETIITDCQYLADEECTGIRMYAIEKAYLDAQGNLTPETAKDLAARYFSVKAEELTVPETTQEGVYTFTLGDKTCTVDAFDGNAVGA